MTSAVGKALIVNKINHKVLVLIRANHPKFHNEIDLPGGTSDGLESLKQTTTREVFEETGIKLKGQSLNLIVTSRRFSSVGRKYGLFSTYLSDEPEIRLSWEHSSYEWMDFEELIERSKGTNDSFLKMVQKYQSKIRLSLE